MRPTVPSGPFPTVSAVVCTRDRPDKLRRALASLYGQSEPPLEIVVVDNAPSHRAARSVVEEFFPATHYLQEPAVGLDFARNRALRAAQGDIVAFLDDDAIAAESWCETIRRAFAEDPRLGTCTGRVEPLMLETEAQRLFEANGGMHRGTHRVVLPAAAEGSRLQFIALATRFAVGCNLAVRRSVAASLGGFDEALDCGALLPGGGDLDIVWRTLQAGWTVRYEPEMAVWHDHRRELSDVRRQIAGHQRALVAFLVKSLAIAHVRDRLAILVYLGWRLVKPGVRLLRRARGRDPLPVSFLLNTLWSCWAGLTAYPLARGRARRERGRWKQTNPMETAGKRRVRWLN